MLEICLVFGEAARLTARGSGFRRDDTQVFATEGVPSLSRRSKLNRSERLPHRCREQGSPDPVLAYPYNDTLSLP